MIKLDCFEVDCFGIKEFKMFTKEKNIDISSIKYTPSYEQYKMGYGEQNPNILCMVYGNDKEYTFHKKNTYDLLVAILGKEHLQTFGITKSIFENLCKQNGMLNVLNKTLRGSAFVMLSPHDDYHENGIPVTGKYITSISKSGEIRAKNLKEAFHDDVSYEELYHYHSQEKSM